MIPYGRHHIDEDDMQVVAKVFRNGHLNQDPTKEMFEQAVVEFVGAKCLLVYPVQPLE